MWNWSDLFGGLNSLVGLGNLGMNFYSMFNRPSPNYGSMQPQGPPPGYQPFDMSGYMEGFGEMMAGWQEQMAAQQQMMMDEQRKGLARSASSARRALQGQGVTWDPNNPNVGAGGVDAMAAQMGVSPEELMAALKQYGGEFGFEGFGS